jgi:hypothetical protein
MSRYGRILAGTAAKIGLLVLLYSLTRLIFLGCNLTHFPEAEFSHFLA